MTKAHSAAVPADYVRKQTLVNAERYITAELKAYEGQVLGAEERRVALELRLFQEVREDAAGHHPAVQAVARSWPRSTACSRWRRRPTTTATAGRASWRTARSGSRTAATRWSSR